MVYRRKIRSCERSLCPIARVGPTTPTRATARPPKDSTPSTAKLAHVRQLKTTMVNPASGSSLNRNEEQASRLNRFLVERDKEEDGFARLGLEESKEGDTVGGARLTIEMGSLFTIRIIPRVRVAFDTPGSGTL